MVTGTAALLGCIVAGAANLRHGSVGTAAVAAVSSSEPGLSPETEAAASPEADLDALLAGELARVAPDGDVQLSVAVMDLESGDRAVFESGRYDTASIVKVDILAALLLQAQDAGRALTSRERTQATSMIRSSDNTATNALWDTIGGAPGLDSANERLGLTATSAGHNGNWGLTQTTAEDQLILLDSIFGLESPLSQADRDFIEDLMESVAPDQDWGVSVADSSAALKNGWLPRTATGLWDINSIGRVDIEGRDCLIAVLSDGNLTQADGIALVEDATQAAVSVISTAGRAS
ncbi:serine hydrolase [Streptomyces sp. TBY4]|uniref:serine hydrolase n=1 Tax=Streptomyces sp. TBY4 TaxID=2962030 RepID=UPI0020B6BE86|nr:serine hydrolase [Streptomyces sp. TBY4]MCP3758918.1 serine hydrolase [Streptomyces sp. TBY4]